MCSCLWDLPLDDCRGDTQHLQKTRAKAHFMRCQNANKVEQMLFMAATCSSGHSYVCTFSASEGLPQAQQQSSGGWRNQGDP